MTYQEAIEIIHGFQRFGSKLGLDRMKYLMNLLGNPQNKMKIIHVAGTNGKGSVSRFIASCLTENGYRVGLYTSPFLERFTERIEFDDKEIDEDELAHCTEVVMAYVDRMLKDGKESPTEFELVTAIAFHYFSRKPMDFLILEVGLGGRGDSTNIIDNPVVSVITSISFDHMAQLGDTIEEIAIEKAGIIKNGCDVVSWAKEPAASVIRNIAVEKNSTYYGRNTIMVESKKTMVDGHVFTASSSFRGADIEEIHISMLGEHQIENASCALAVVELLRQKGIISTDDSCTKMGFKKAMHPGRMEILRKDPMILIDGAHNHDGAKALVKGIHEHFQEGRTLLILGMLEDKEIDKMLLEFLRIPGDIVASEPDNPRRFSAEKLAAKIKDAGKECVLVTDVHGACDYIDNHIGDYDLVVAAGSLYLIGTIRGRFKDGYQ